MTEVPPSHEVLRQLDAAGGLAALKRDARMNFAPGSPYRVAVEALPDSVSREEFVVHLRLLLPMLRLRESP